MSKKTRQQKQPQTNRKQSSRVFVLWALALIAFAVGTFFIAQKPGQAADIVVYKSPSCGCCGKWIEHLKENGYSVEVHNQWDMDSIKASIGIPAKVKSCHTAKVGDYVIEGHVPADLIAKLLRDKPAVKGLAVPGMPMGSPGMEGPRKDDYNVLTFDADGHTTVYARR